jgi:vacuolar protein sorting-associated protein 13A/C
MDSEHPQVAQNKPKGGTNITISARERLDLNISTTFAELAITTLNMLGKEGEQVFQKARGSYAPYRIRNRTGVAIFVWSDIDGNSSTQDSSAVKVLHDQTVDWRFDDWRTMREVTEAIFITSSVLSLCYSTSPRASIV